MSPHALMVAGLVSLLLFDSGFARTINGFNIENDALIPVDDIHSGGPPRDGIPSIDKPRFISVAEAADMRPQDRVLGLVRGGVIKAYPIAILNWHEIINDRFGTEPVVVTYCPLCGSGVAYKALLDGMEAGFGVSGLLYNSDVLLYDRETQSLWSQMLSTAVSGPMKGTRLKMLPLAHTNWAEWRSDYPNTLVLSRKTGFQRDYGKDPYAGYQDSKGVWFPVADKDPRYHPKERVMGLELDGRFKAYPFAELSKGAEEVKDRFNGRELTVRYRPNGQSASIVGENGKEIPTLIAFWFAWYAFHPDTEVYQAP